MNNSILKNLLMALPIFAHLTDDEYRIVAFIGKRKEHVENEILYGSNNFCGGAILVSAGRASVQFVNSQKPDILVRRGMLIHEMALFNDKRLLQNVRAMEHVTCYHFNREEFKHLTEEFPEIGRKIQINIAAKLGKFNQALKA